MSSRLIKRPFTQRNVLWWEKLSKWWSIATLMFLLFCTTRKRTRYSLFQVNPSSHLNKYPLWS